MANYRNSERRKHFRTGARPGRRIDIQFREKGATDDYETAITRNIGVGGAFIVTDLRPDVGSLIDLIIDIPEQSQSLILSAEVRWLADGEDGTKGGLGVRFLELDVPSLLALSEYFAALNAPSSEPDDDGDDRQ